MPGPKSWLRRWFAPVACESRRVRLSVTSLEDRAVPATASYTLINAWNTGQQAEITIVNTDGPAQNTWQVAFDYSGTINDYWNAKLISHTGSHYVFANADWNGNIPVGGKTSFGFTSSSSPAPTQITVNGVPVGGGQPAVTVSVTGGSVVEGDPATPGNPGLSAGFLSTSGNQIVDAAGHPVQLAGVNWFGLESRDFAPHGLWTRGYQDMMNQMKQLGFNVIRLPISSELLKPSSLPTNINYAVNPDLVGLNGLGVLDKVIDYAGQIGLRVFLDHHRTLAGNGADGGLWYEPGTEYTDAKFAADWQFLAARYAGNPTVIGADLHNEPHGAATWGSGDLATDWRLAAERAGNAIHAVNPNWLIIVEGTERGPSGNYWWGGNLSAAGQYPVRLNQPGKLVYSAHDYPSTVYNQPWFSSPNYPDNLPAVWEANWGYLFQQNIAPVLLGEFGTKLATPSDRVWLDKLTDYLGGDRDGNGTNDLPAGSLGMSWTYWSWNPNSSDTGGILADDWRTVHTDKLALLQSIQYPLLDSGTGGGTTPTPNAITFTVRLSAASTTPVSVAYTTQGGTATAGVDFTSISGTVTFAPGETVQTILVPITGDDLTEGNETFSLVLTQPSGATIDTATATGTILDDDTSLPPPPPPPPPLPVVTINTVSQKEGNTAGNAVFTIQLSGASSQPVTVSYATQNGTATAGSDFTAISGVLTFAPGETTKTVSVPVLGDTTVEPDETFRLTLSSPTGAVLGTTTFGTATLLNDDLPPPPPPPPPPPATGTGGASLAIGSSWNSGFIGNVTVTNNGNSAWKDWTLTFEAGYTITNIWGAEIVSHVGTTYTVKAASWNRSVPPGGSVTFGFQATRPADATMTLGNPVLVPMVS